MNETYRDEIADFTRRKLLGQGKWNDAYRAEIRGLEAEGYRIVGGGATAEEMREMVLGEGSWEITDWRTGEVLAKGNDGPEGYAQASDSLGKIYHIDNVGDTIADADPGTEDEPPEPKGFPPTLAWQIAWAAFEWADGPRTPDWEIADLTGWDEKRVHSLRTEDGDGVTGDEYMSLATEDKA